MTKKTRIEILINTDLEGEFEDIREAIEDNCGVEILEINELELKDG